MHMHHSRGQRTTLGFGHYLLLCLEAVSLGDYSMLAGLCVSGDSLVFGSHLTEGALGSQKCSSMSSFL